MGKWYLRTLRGKLHIFRIAITSRSFCSSAFFSIGTWRRPSRDSLPLNAKADKKLSSWFAIAVPVVWLSLIVFSSRNSLSYCLTLDCVYCDCSSLLYVSYGHFKVTSTTSLTMCSMHNCVICLQYSAYYKNFVSFGNCTSRFISPFSYRIALRLIARRVLQAASVAFLPSFLLCRTPLLIVALPD